LKTRETKQQKLGEVELVQHLKEQLHFTPFEETHV